MLVFLFYPYTIATLNPPISDKVSIVVIDPGHGGKDPGALGSKIKEKDVVYITIKIKMKLFISMKEKY